MNRRSFLKFVVASVLAPYSKLPMQIAKPNAFVAMLDDHFVTTWMELREEVIGSVLRPFREVHHVVS